MTQLAETVDNGEFRLSCVCDTAGCARKLVIQGPETLESARLRAKERHKWQVDDTTCLCPVCVEAGGAALKRLAGLP